VKEEALGRSGETRLPRLSAVRACLSDGVPSGKIDDDSARRQWWAALAILQDELLLKTGGETGIWLAAPLPALYEPQVLQHLQGWVWAPERIEELLGPKAPLLPPDTVRNRGDNGGFQRMALLEGDGTDPLLLLLTPRVQVGLCLDGAAGERRLVARFEPAVLSQALHLIHMRLAGTDGRQDEQFRSRMQLLGSLHSDPDFGARFWPRLADRLAAMAPSVTLQPLMRETPMTASTDAAGPPSVSGELALLEALTHEVRTPLATIRTLIRSLLRRSDLSAVVRQRLDQIDSECSEQIDRFGLIFLAAELQGQPQSPGTGQERGFQLARTDLSALLVQLSDLWARQLARRNLELQLSITPELPAVLSDPVRLETMLGGLIDRFSRGLPAGSSVCVGLEPAGSRLKLQLRCSSSAATSTAAESERSSRQSVGPVLSWNPVTGSLQLSRQATQHLFRRLGGRLTERSGRGLTVFFPIC
jgi:signal transduction histidine kinase